MTIQEILRLTADNIDAVENHQSSVPGFAPDFDHLELLFINLAHWQVAELLKQKHDTPRALTPTEIIQKPANN